MAQRHGFFPAVLAAAAVLIAAVAMFPAAGEAQVQAPGPLLDPSVLLKDIGTVKSQASASLAQALLNLGTLKTQPSPTITPSPALTAQQQVQSIQAAIAARNAEAAAQWNDGLSNSIALATKTMNQIGIDMTTRDGLAKGANLALTQTLTELAFIQQNHIRLDPQRAFLLQVQLDDMLRYIKNENAAIAQDQQTIKNLMVTVTQLQFAKKKVDPTESHALDLLTVTAQKINQSATPTSVQSLLAASGAITANLQLIMHAQP